MSHSTTQSGFIGKILLLMVFGGIFLSLMFNRYLVAPERFPAPYELTIEPGQTLFSVSQELYDAGIIRSPRLFEMIMLTLGSDKNISAGQYYFSEPMSTIGIALRISGKDFGIDRQKITFPEGFSNAEMAKRFGVVFPGFDTNAFLTQTKGKQGYLFPDTYSFFPTLQVDEAIKALEENFSRKTKSLDNEIAQSGHSLEDIIIMASIIEKEANGPEDRKMVSGILWKRIETNMPLQVDAPFLYLFGKESKDLTREDLATNSPYNTYINTGLPPAPINNPGLASIEAALRPTSSPYLYYLHDANGSIHYARTYEEHKKNIAAHLR